MWVGTGEVCREWVWVGEGGVSGVGVGWDGGGVPGVGVGGDGAGDMPLLISAAESPRDGRQPGTPGDVIMTSRDVDEGSPSLCGTSHHFTPRCRLNENHMKLTSCSCICEKPFSPYKDSKVNCSSQSFAIPEENKSVSDGNCPDLYIQDYPSNYRKVLLPITRPRIISLLTI